LWYLTPVTAGRSLRSLHVMPARVSLPPRPVSPAPHWVKRTAFSVSELAAGYGPGWPPPTRLRAPARRLDLASRRSDFSRLRHLRRRAHGAVVPRGSRHADISLALDATQSLTTTCPRCRGLVDVCVLRRRLKRCCSPAAGCAGPACTSAFRPASYVASQSKMAAALTAGDRILVTRRSVTAGELVILSPADVARAVAWVLALLVPVRARCRA